MTEQTELEKEFLEAHSEVEKKYGHAGDWDNYIKHLFYWEKDWLKRPEDLDRLVKSDNPDVRKLVAEFKRDKDLDKLVNDPDEDVRVAVVLGGREQDILALFDDPSEDVHLALRVIIKQKLEDLKFLQQRLEEK